MFGKSNKKAVGNGQAASLSSTSKYKQTSTLSSSSRSVYMKSVTTTTTSISEGQTSSFNKYNGASNTKDVDRWGSSFDAIRNDRSTPFDREFGNPGTPSITYQSPYRSLKNDARLINPSSPSSVGYNSPFRNTATIQPGIAYPLKPVTTLKPVASSSSSSTPIAEITSILRNPIVTKVEKSVEQQAVKAIKKKPTKRLEPGIVYIFNHEKFDNGNETRVGTQEDVKRLKKIFNGRFKMETKTYNNLTVKQIDAEARKIEKHDFTKKACVVIVILTHGSRHDMVSARDDIYSIDDVLLFPMLKNKTLIEKPKIFIVQACKGDKATSEYAYSDAKPEKLYSPSQIAKLYSTFEGFLSYRGASGSMFIQILCDNLERDGSTKNVIQIMEETIKQIVEQYSSMQIPTITHNMTLPLVFGHYV